MPTMVTEREGYRTLFVQIPLPLWQALAAEADRAHDGSLTKAISRILQDRYKVPASKMPKPRRMGRPHRE